MKYVNTPHQVGTFQSLFNRKSGISVTKPVYYLLRFTPSLFHFSDLREALRETPHSGCQNFALKRVSHSGNPFHQPGDIISEKGQGFDL